MAALASPIGKEIFATRRMHTVTKKWTEEELEAQGFNKIVIGVPGRPLPIMVPNPEGNSQDTAYRLEVIEDEQDPIIIWSQRPYAEVVGMIYRLLPTPSMLPLYYETLQLLQIENDRRIQFYIGKHGSGKSFLGRLVGDILHPEGAVTINCADRDLNELLFETVLDVGANPDLYSKINQKLRDGTMNLTSIAALKSVVGSAFHEDNGYPEIAFENVGATTYRTFKTEEGLVETEAIPSNADTRNVVETILKIAQVEGLSEAASFMPIKSQTGLLPRMWEAGRCIHLEEYNKCKEGSDTCLHPVLQVFNGENMRCTVYGSGGLSFGFDNAERMAGFFCYLDGNMMQDGVATHSLSASANDRILPNIIQDMIKEDWQHRWCQLLTGLPIKVLYMSKKDQWDADPDGFTRFLHMIRGLGGVKVAASHSHYIDRWEDVLDATDIISNYNSMYDEMTNPDSIANRQGKYPELFAEVDEEFYNMAGGSMRRNIYYFKMAMLGRPATVQPHLSQGYDLSNSWDAPPATNPRRDNRNPQETMGTNIVDIFYRDMVRLTLGLGKVHLYTRLKVAFETLRMMKPQLAEGIVLDSVYLEDLLNSDPKESDNARQLQALFCSALRLQFPNTPMSGEDDHLMTQDQVRSALDKAASTALPESKDNRLRYCYAQNYAPLVTVDNLIQPFALMDGLPWRDTAAVAVREEDQMQTERFLMSLALPKIGRKNQINIWTPTIFDALSSPLAVQDPAVLITSNESDTGIAFSTVQTAGSVLHMVRDGKKNTLLVVGGSISDELQAILKEAGVDYIDRDQPNAKTRVRTFLNRTLIKLPKDFEHYLVASFFHRNTLPDLDLREDAQALESHKMAALMTRPDATPRFPVFATQLMERKRITAYLDQAAVANQH